MQSAREVGIMKSAIFKAAHALTRNTVKAGDSYQVTFAAALRMISKMVKIGGNIWAKESITRIYFDIATMIEIKPFKKTSNMFIVGDEVMNETEVRAFKTKLVGASAYFDVATGFGYKNCKGDVLSIASEIANSI